jgi:NADP-dependent 3-hydroxy acid dehydrogenase YdfG
MAEESSGPVVVVTGASAGIGAAVARELAGRRASLVLTARREEILREMAATLGTPVEVVPGDVTRRVDVQRVLDRGVSRFGAVDVWVNNAGRGITRASVEAIADEDLDAMVRDNVRSVLYGMQAVLPHFKARQRGVLVNVSSMLSRVPLATFRAAYSASKAAVNALTEAARVELAKDFPGIRVVLVLPGVVATEFGINALGGGPDSRTLPGTQPVDEVARVIADGLFSGPVDVYTRPPYLETVLGHLRGLAGQG